MDYVFVWGKYYENLYLKSKLNQNQEIRILGYPYPLQEKKFTQYNKRVVYLGQPLELYGDSFYDIKKETTTKD